MGPTEPGTQGPWLPVYAAGVAVALVVADRYAILDVSVWAFPVMALAGSVLTFVLTLMQESGRGGTGWAGIFAHRIVTLLAAGSWATWVGVTGWTSWTILGLLGGTAGLSALGLVAQTPAANVILGPAATPVPDSGEPYDPRHPILIRWERIIRAVTKLPVVVLALEAWDNPDDGLRLVVSLPADLGTTAGDLVPKAGAIAASARLPKGCAVTVLDGDQQGIAVLDVMLRNVLADDASELHDEPTTQASINDSFPVLTTPRGELLSICLRIYSMIIGGTTGSGKTTLLHRIVMYLARCVDALVWVVDLNGGGIAEPWVNPWANGKTTKPVVDWVADNEAEAAVMVAVAGAIARDRKTNREATRRKRAANTTVLPVDAQLPAIVVLTDEGGEVRQAVSLLGQLAGQGITRLAQIGRAEGVRVIMSVLRGTADLTDKGLRVNAALRLCLRMEEHDEYAHVLGQAPGKTDLAASLGAGFLRTAEITRPVLGRTVNVDLASIDRHAIATGHLRPDLDERAQLVAASLKARDVLGGKEPTKELLAVRALADCQDGQAYAGRWGRYAAKLAEMRGEEYAEQDEPAPAAASAPNPVGSAATSGLDAWAAAVGGVAQVDAPPARQAVAAAAPSSSGGAQVIPLFGHTRPGQQSAPAPAAADTAREQILALLRDAGAEGVTTGQLVDQVDATRSRVFDLLKNLKAAGDVGQNAAGRNVLAQYAQTG